MTPQHLSYFSPHGVAERNHQTKDLGLIHMVLHPHSHIYMSSTVHLQPSNLIVRYLLTSMCACLDLNALLLLFQGQETTDFCHGYGSTQPRIQSKNNEIQYSEPMQLHIHKQWCVS
ncbi:hypothetical protein QR685DRAFT_513795, partial [Neurospora intermedia]